MSERLLAFLLFGLLGCVVRAQNFCPEYAPECFCGNEYTVTCNNFRNLDDLKFAVPAGQLNSIRYFILDPLEPIHFTSLPSLSRLPFDFVSVEIVLSRFKSFNFLVNPFEDLKRAINTNSSQHQLPYKVKFNLVLGSCVLDFYYLDRLLVSDDEPTSSSTVNCNDLNLGDYFTPLFASFDRITIESSSLIQRKICQAAFQNAVIHELFIFNMTDQAAQSGLVNYNQQQKINCQIDGFFIYSVQRLYLTRRFLNPNLFQFLFSLNVYDSNVYEIERDLFRDMKRLRIVSLELNNFDEFIRLSDNYWMSYLNIGAPTITDLTNYPLIYMNSSFSQIQLEILFSDLKQKYQFKNEDICLFQHFPHAKIVYPALSSAANLECSCTMIWLIQYWKYYLNQAKLHTQTTSKCLSLGEQEFRTRTTACNFNRTLSLCKQQPTGASASITATTTTSSSQASDAQPSKANSDLALALSIGLPIVFLIFLLVIVVISCLIKSNREMRNRVIKTFRI